MEENNSVNNTEEIIEKVDTANECKKKKRSVSYFTLAISLILVAILVFQITYLAVGQMYKRQMNSLLSNTFSNAKINEISQIYKENFIYDFTDEDILNGLIQGYIYGTGDRYGHYYTAEEYKAYTEQLNDRSVGIGIIVGFNGEANAIEVYRVYENSPASKAGIEQGDLVFSVDGSKVSDVGYATATDMILGEIGENVVLTVQKKDTMTTKDITVTRNEYTATTVEYKLVSGIAYIKITNFYKNTATELKNAIIDLKGQGAESIIFDVRDNGGGSLTSIVETLDYLLPEGIMFTIKDKKGKTEEYRSDKASVDMPMAVLVNGNTASAAELFTSALSDYGKAVSIGEKTHGKGSVSTPFALSDGSHIYISTALYYPPKSDNFDGEGIIPDHKVSLSHEASQISLYKLPVEDDDQLKFAIELLK